jgi:cytochrome d ubiquinol oxidase subunit II
MQDYLVVILPLVWAVVIAFGIFVYVLLDGFDLGLGLLFLAAPSHAARDTMMRSVAPVWDGNETWLVLGGAALFAAFPLAYAVILPALYLPLVLMLIGLILRGVAFEFRFKADSSRFLWDWAFAGGSLLATAMQGIALGVFIQGFAVVDRHYAGGAFDWLTPFSILTAFALVAGYTLLACGWLIMKTGGRAAGLGLRPGRARARHGRRLRPRRQHLDAAAERRCGRALVQLAQHPDVLAGAHRHRGGRGGALPRVAPAPRLLPFALTAALFVLSYTGIAVSLFPYIIPPDITIWHAASPPETQSFLLVGLVPILPIILGYTLWNYYVFRGRVRESDGYH